MSNRIFLSLLLICLSLFVRPVFADDGYVGADLGNDIYKRLDQGIYKLKKQLVEKRLEGSSKKINSNLGQICPAKQGKVKCLRDEVDFTTTELDDIVGGSVGPIYTHLNPLVGAIDTGLAVQIRLSIVEHYQDLQKSVAYDQERLQSVGSIGLFTDGNRDNSSYDLMVDLENIHSVIFAKEIPYNGTSNLGASSANNLAADIYDHPFLSLNPWDSVIFPKDKDPGVSPVPPTSTGSVLASGSCAPVPVVNLDPNFFRDVQSQLTVGTNPDSSLAFSDDGKLPEYWAKIAAANGGSPGSAGIGGDSFPCSGKDIFCILVSMVNYSQNLFGGGKTPTIEYILDENLKIANKFAPSSLVQSKMTKMFFGLDLVGLDLPSMAHIGVVVSRLPPPILNLKAGTTGGPANGNPESTGQKDEFNQILVGAFDEEGLDFKRQNALLEYNDESRMIHNLTYLTTDSVNEKSDMSTAPKQSGYIAAKEMELKKSYGDSFNDDLFELHAFTLAFTKSIGSVTSIIKKMYEIPQK